MPTKEKDREVTFEITEKIGVIGKNNSSGWKRELNLVSWNGNPAKYDIRDWDENHKLMSRGITLNKEEANVLCELLKEEKLS
ncbi:YdbC family protein [Anaerovorax odorimutans]|uniref:YdbC family protein n=1 Tax=Anaerovorax odorimutans TaxID=109327 RepID=UPI00041AA7F4|nr:PC4/YdbC family ssDNA-binding protein [Anaerovorax odorimutans]